MTQDTELLDVSEARRRLLDHITTVDGETVPLEKSVGRILAESVFAEYDLPPFSNSSMDGYAVRAEDVITASAISPVELEVVADIPAGENAKGILESGQAMRIMTGAPVPQGSDAVVKVEDTNFMVQGAGDKAPARVKIHASVESGHNIRPAGQDLKCGEMAIDAGRKLRPQDAGFLGMLGIARVPVRRRPKIAVFSTGDELLPVEAPLLPGKIHDANTYTLVGMIEQNGGEAINLGIIGDRPAAVQEALNSAIKAHSDLILSSAGVSVGAFDFVRSVVEKDGSLKFWRVNMRPGKPIAFGHYRAIPFVGLPGNPVSAYVGFEVFVKPALYKMLGVKDATQRAWRAILDEPIESDGRESYLRCIVSWNENGLTARLTGHQGSGNLSSLVQANALLLVPSGVKYLPPGDPVEVFLFESSIP